MNYRCARWITRWLVKLPVTPNQVTLCSLGVGVVAILAFSRGSWWSAILGAWCLEVVYVLDHCDGELARMRGAVTVLGQWLDTVVDTVIHVGLFPAMAVGLVRQGLTPSLTAVGYVGASATLVIYGITMIQEHRREHRLSRALPGWHHMKDVARTDYALLVLFCALAGWLPGLLWISAVGACVLCGAMTVHVLRGGQIL